MYKNGTCELLCLALQYYKSCTGLFCDTIVVRNELSRVIKINIKACFIIYMK